MGICSEGYKTDYYPLIAMKIKPLLLRWRIKQLNMEDKKVISLSF
jgi:hypothetical protein